MNVVTATPQSEPDDTLSHSQRRGTFFDGATRFFFNVFSLLLSFALDFVFWLGTICAWP
jgi:hypothetical protein